MYSFIFCISATVMFCKVSLKVEKGAFNKLNRIINLSDPPAVVLPSGLKAGRSLASPSSVVVGLTPSSWLTVTWRCVPSSSSTVVLTGTISCWNRPAFCARAALPRPESGSGQQQWGNSLTHSLIDWLTHWLLLGAEGEGVLLLSGHTEPLSYVFRRDAAATTTNKGCVPLASQLAWKFAIWCSLRHRTAHCTIPSHWKLMLSRYDALKCLLVFSWFRVNIASRFFVLA